jgi:hypothetical protein
MNYSITIVTLESPLYNNLFPVINAPINYKPGISKGKLKGEIKATGP